MVIPRSSEMRISTLENIGKLNMEINEMKDEVESAVKTKEIYEKKQGFSVGPLFCYYFLILPLLRIEIVHHL